MGRKIYINIDHQEKKDWRRDESWKPKKKKAKEGYEKCLKCLRWFPVYAAKVNGHEGHCSKRCKFGKGKKRRIRELEANLSPEERRTNRQLRRQERLKAPFIRPVLTADFYDSPEWRNLRYRVLRKYGFKCMACGARPGVYPLHVDHIKPRSKYPDLELDENNLQVLCRDCNLGKSNHFDDDLRNIDAL